MNYLELATRSPPLAPAVRVRVALDVLEEAIRAAPAANAAARRATIADVRLEPSGRARLAHPATSHLATLLWEIVAARLAETDDLPWSDPAEDLPAAVIDVFASLAVRPPAANEQLAQRFAAACAAHACERAQVQRAMPAGADSSQTIPTSADAKLTNPPATQPAPAMTLRTLRALSALADDGEPPGQPIEEAPPPSKSMHRATAWKPFALGRTKPRTK